MTKDEDFTAMLERAVYHHWRAERRTLFRDEALKARHYGITLHVHHRVYAAATCQRCGVQVLGSDKNWALYNGLAMDAVSVAEMGGAKFTDGGPLCRKCQR